MQRWEANKKADQELKFKDKHVFLRKYEALISYILQLKNGIIHERIMADVESFMKDGCSRQRSIKLALHKNAFFFRSMFEFDDSNYKEDDGEDDVVKDEEGEYDTDGEVDDESG